MDRKPFYALSLIFVLFFSTSCNFNYGVEKSFDPESFFDDSSIDNIDFSKLFDYVSSTNSLKDAEIGKIQITVKDDKIKEFFMEVVDSNTNKLYTPSYSHLSKIFKIKVGNSPKKSNFYDKSLLDNFTLILKSDQYKLNRNNSSLYFLNDISEDNIKPILFSHSKFYLFNENDVEEIKNIDIRNYMDNSLFFALHNNEDLNKDSVYFIVKK